MYVYMFVTHVAAPTYLLALNAGAPGACTFVTRKNIIDLLCLQHIAEWEMYLHRKVIIH